MFPCHATAVKM